MTDEVAREDVPVTFAKCVLDDVSDLTAAAAARCIECTAADRRDDALVARLGRSDVTTVADAYRDRC